MSDARHVPVLLPEVLAALAPAPGDVLVDATFGAGGYASALLQAAPVTVLALDRDRDAVAEGAPLVARFAPRLRLRLCRFGALDAALAAEGLGPVQGVVFDLGVSSMQLDRAGRGFSFRADGPLDMRMGAAESDTPTAADLVNTLPEGRLAEILRRFGEERAAGRIARALVAARAAGPITTTAALAGLVRRALGDPKGLATDPATRTFQALRIAVNDELGELARGLAAAERALAPGGRLAVVTFHSLEDRIVKSFLRARGGRTPAGSRHLPPTADTGPDPSFRLIAPGGIAPGTAELAANPRSRSARLRAAIRTDAPAWPAPSAEEMAA